MSWLANRTCSLVFCFLMTGLSFANISVPFELVNGLIIIEAEINGTIGNYVVDSGSNGILLNGHSNLSDVSYQTLTSTLEGRETIIESFKVGDFEAGELLGFSTDLSNLEIYLEKQIAGILGCSIFTPNSLIFDFTNSKMVISEDAFNKKDIEGLSCLSFTIIEDLPVAKVNIQGHAFAFILDSGASSHFIDKKLISRFKASVEPTGVKKNIITAAGNGQISSEYNIPNCKFGDANYTFLAFEKDFTPISESLGMDISGLISLNKLSKSKVYIDLNSKNLYYN